MFANSWTTYIINALNVFISTAGYFCEFAKMCENHETFHPVQNLYNLCKMHLKRYLIFDKEEMLCVLETVNFD